MILINQWRLQVAQNQFNFNAEISKISQIFFASKLLFFLTIKLYVLHSNA